MPLKKATLLVVANAKMQALNKAILLVFAEKRTTTYFLYLGEESLPCKKRTYKFTSLGDLIKHFK